MIDASGTGVSAQLNLDFVADNPSQISVQAGPASVNVQGDSTITALVRDATNNLVEGATVAFQITADPTNGGLSAPTAVTNAQGMAQVVYTAGNSSSGANGVVNSRLGQRKGRRNDLHWQHDTDGQRPDCLPVIGYRQYD